MNDNDLTRTALTSWSKREYDCIWGEAGAIELRCTTCQNSERSGGCFYKTWEDDDHDFVPYMAYVRAWADERHLIGEHDYFPTELCTICN